MQKFVIGIDTGGTFTDAVLLGFRDRKVYKSAKSLTTRHDLKEGVIRVIDKLKINEPEKVKLVGISSTLATNSIAEKSSRKTALILIGYDREMMESFHLIEKIKADEVVWFSGGHDSQGKRQAPLDMEGIKKWIAASGDRFDAFAVSSYFSPLNTEDEEAVYRYIKQKTDLPVVMAHQLSTRLDSVKRAGTASVNSSLVAIMNDFLIAVKDSLNRHNIHAPLMVVRGDGTLMPFTEAVQKPVETIVSGPAASAVGGRFLSGYKNALVVDMGSTTTDIAMIKDNSVEVGEEGARVGDQETSISAARIRTLCMGCDSRIQLDDKKRIQIGPERVTSISQICHEHPSVSDHILKLRYKPKDTWKRTDIEYWYLYNCPDEQALKRLLPSSQKTVEILADGPVSVTDIVRKAGVYHPGQIEIEYMFKQGYVGIATLSPTDLLHIEGQMELWEDEAARKALKVFCYLNGLHSSDIIEDVFDTMIHKIVEEMVIFMAYQGFPGKKMPYEIDGKWGRWLFEEMLTGKNDYLSVNIDSRYPIIGTGAPAKFFVRRAAEELSAPFKAPSFFEVANAVGAVSGSVMEMVEARVFEQKRDRRAIYIVHIREDHFEYDELEKALDFAEDETHKRVHKEILEAGGHDPFIEHFHRNEGGLHRLTARAVANPRLSEDD